MYSYNNLNEFVPYEGAIVLQSEDKVGGEIFYEDSEEIWKWTEEKFKQKFKQFATIFKKKYLSEEEKKKRFSIFKKNMYYIHTHNQQGFDYTLRINQFGDLTNEEFKAKYVGYKKSAGLKSLGVATELLNYIEDDLPLAVNWKSRGCVAEIKNQAQCGSCWAFSSTGALEGAICAKTGKLLDLSEQQLVDCAGKEGNYGCEGGEMERAFQYVIDNKGLCSEQDYKYEGKQGICRADKCKSVLQITGFKNVPSLDETAMKAALKIHGPISVAIEADQLPFQFYHQGIFSASCGHELNHGVLAVGYGKDENFQKEFWEIKNSWGEGWGEKGFMRMAMHHGKFGECGILMEGVFPEV